MLIRNLNALPGYRQSLTVGLQSLHHCSPAICKLAIFFVVSECVPETKRTSATFDGTDGTTLDLNVTRHMHNMSRMMSHDRRMSHDRCTCHMTDDIRTTCQMTDAWHVMDDVERLRHVSKRQYKPVFEMITSRLTEALLSIDNITNSSFEINSYSVTNSGTPTRQC